MEFIKDAEIVTTLSLMNAFGYSRGGADCRLHSLKAQKLIIHQLNGEMAKKILARKLDVLEFIYEKRLAWAYQLEENFAILLKKFKIKSEFARKRVALPMSLLLHSHRIFD